MKICPVCESTLFDDMDTCFGCLYRFGSDPALEAARSAKAVPWPVDGGEGECAASRGGEGRFCRPHRPGDERSWLASARALRGASAPGEFAYHRDRARLAGHLLEETIGLG